MDRRKSPSRAGFTLVEVLVVILIIGTLIAILLPALAGAFRKAREAQVTAELNNLATALASFKNTYGDYPPSRIVLCETGYSSDPNVNANAATLYSSNMIAGPDSNDTDMSQAQLTQRSLLYLRKFWPRVNFNNAFDFNNKNGTNDGVYILSGSECLAFFLGGQPLNDGAGNITGMSGFSKLPTNPFAAAATNRTVPNYEFNAGRLVDLDGDGIPSYLDPIDISPGNRRAYAYFASYGVNSYDPNDDNGLAGRSIQELEEDGSTDVERGFTVGFQIATTTTPPNMAISPAPNPYCSSQPAYPASNTTPPPPVAWINATSFQLFSAGQDRYWGLGGTYVQNSLGATGKLPILPNAADPGNIHSDDATGIRNRESDNLTNFSGGRLD